VDVVGEQTAQTAQPVQNGPSADESRYEEIVQRLAKVVERLEGGGLSLEESIAAFEEGIRLARAGAAKLEEAERKVELLLENDRTAPFGTDDGSRR
jgi:exodeoxyribonuclease VII small subunit